MEIKQLAEMLKSIRKKKMDEMSTTGSFVPIHTKKKGEEDSSSPNQYLHRMTNEARVPLMKGKHDLGSPRRALKIRKRGNQNGAGRYLNLNEKGEIDLGNTDTGKKGKEAETVTVNPRDTSNLAKGELNKNNTVKETKEK